MRISLLAHSSPPQRVRPFGSRLSCAPWRPVATTALLAMLISCGGTLPEVEEITPEQEQQLQQESTIDTLLQQARRSASPEAERLTLDAIDLMVAAQAAERAQQTLAAMRAENLPVDLRTRYTLTRAELMLSQEDAEGALALLQPAALSDTTQPLAIQIRTRELRARAHQQSGQYLPALRERIALNSLLGDMEPIDNINSIWELLSLAPDSAFAGASVDSYELRGWLELRRLINSNSYSVQGQINALEQWRDTWNQHRAASRLPEALAMLNDIRDNRPDEIALVLPMQEPLGKAISEGFLSAYYDELARGLDVPRVRIYDTSFRTDVLVLYDQAVDDGVDMIIGPLLKDAVRRMQRSSRPMPVPTLALNYGDPGGGVPGDLYQFGLAPEDEIRQAVDAAWAAGHRNAVVLTPAGEDYLRIQDTFRSYWEALGGRVLSVDTFSGSDYSPTIKHMFAIDASETRAAQIRNLIPRNNIQFTPRRREDVDFIFLLANPAEGRQIKPTLSFHFAGDVPVYAMPAIHDAGANPVANRDLNGVIFSDAPWILNDMDPLKASAADTWAPASGPVRRLRAMGVDSYRLFLRLEQMQRFPYTRVQGATGILSLKPDGGIQRELENAVITDGIANVLPR